MHRILWFALAASLFAQQAPFGVQSRLVLVPVTVTDAKGKPLDGLEPGAFTVFDNGQLRPVTVDTITTGVAPLALVVAVQASGISLPVLDKVTRVGSMIQPLLTGERGCAAVLAFSEELKWVQECTSNPDLIARAFHNIQPGEYRQARLLDAASAAIDKLRNHPNSRRALLLISETRDRGSETEIAPVLVAAQSAGVAVYSASYSAFLSSFTERTTRKAPVDKRRKTPIEETGGHTAAPPACGLSGCPDFPLPPPEQRVDLLAAIGELVRLGQVNTADALAKGTGGAVFSFNKLRGLEEAIEKLSAEVHAQYLLSFAPTEAAPGPHKIEVRVAFPNARVRARPAYWVQNP